MKDSHSVDAAGQAFFNWIQRSELPSLGPERGRGLLSTEQLDQALDDWLQEFVLGKKLGPLFRSAALFWHDHLDASHTISQSIRTPEGSLLHGMMHRREPDYPNAKYWFSRAGHHAIEDVLSQRLKEEGRLDAHEMERLVPGGLWDPHSFVDLVEASLAGRPGAWSIDTLRYIQGVEFQSLILCVLGQDD